MSDDNSPKRQASRKMMGAPFFIRNRVFKMMDQDGLSVDQAVSVAAWMVATYNNGVDHGEHQALYARNPESWPWGKVVHVHKIWDMLIVEYEVKDEPGQYRYTAQIDNRHWGKMRKDMHAAIADALGFKHDGDMSTAGEYIIRMLGIEEP